MRHDLMRLALAALDHPAGVAWAVALVCTFLVRAMRGLVSAADAIAARPRYERCIVPVERRAGFAGRITYSAPTRFHEDGARMRRAGDRYPTWCLHVGRYMHRVSLTAYPAV